MQTTVAPDEIAGLADAVRRLGAALTPDGGTDAALAHAVAALGDDAGSAVRHACDELVRAVGALARSYAHYGAGLAQLAQRYDELDRRLVGPVRP